MVEYGGGNVSQTTVRLRISYDDVVTEYLTNLYKNLRPVFKSAADLARVVLVNELFPAAVYKMGLRAGEGFPASYTNHLAAAIRQTRVYISEGMNDISMNITFEQLGDWDDLMLGAHQNALLDSGMDNDDFKSFRRTTKGLLQRNSLPNTVDEGDLYHRPGGNDKAVRTEWWNTAIVLRDFHTQVGANWNWTKPAIRQIEDSWEATNVPTFEQVASDRINKAWRPAGVAPEWLLLEFGSPAGTLPTVRPQAFRAKMQLMAEDAFNKIMIQAFADLERQAREGAGIKRAGRGGQRLAPTQKGQYATYKVTSVPDLTSSLSLI